MSEGVRGLGGGPTDIRLRRASRRLEIDWPGGERVSFPAEFLRVEGPGAAVQGPAPAARKPVPGKAEVGIRAVEPIGRHAIRIVFDDGHDAGVYTWDDLDRLGQEHRERWRRYLAELAAAGLSRHAPRSRRAPR